MKTLHYRWNRSLNWILTTLLGFLGFSSCEDNGDDPGNIICMYGTPTASLPSKEKSTDQARSGAIRYSDYRVRYGIQLRTPS